MYDQKFLVIYIYFIYILYVYIYNNYSYIHFKYYFYSTQIPEINLLKHGTILDLYIKPDFIKYLFLYDISVFILIKCVYFYILNIYIPL